MWKNELKRNIEIMRAAHVFPKRMYRSNEVAEQKLVQKIVEPAGMAWLMNSKVKKIEQ